MLESLDPNRLKPSCMGKLFMANGRDPFTILLSKSLEKRSPAPRQWLGRVRWLFVDKASSGGHNEKASLKRISELVGGSLTALVPEWRNWQTR